MLSSSDINILKEQLDFQDRKIDDLWDDSNRERRELLLMIKDIYADIGGKNFIEWHDRIQERVKKIEKDFGHVITK